MIAHNITTTPAHCVGMVLEGGDTMEINDTQHLIEWLEEASRSAMEKIATLPRDTDQNFLGMMSGMYLAYEQVLRQVKMSQPV